jgi:hypothetical protein
MNAKVMATFSIPIGVIFREIDTEGMKIRISANALPCTYPFNNGS